MFRCAFFAILCIAQVISEVHTTPEPGANLLDSGILRLLGMINRELSVDIDPCDDEEYSWTDVCLQELSQEVNFTLFNRDGKIQDFDNTTGMPPERRGFIIIHGWLDDVGRKWVRKMRKALLHKVDSTVMLVNWSRFSRNPYYLGVVDKLPRIGKAIAGELKDMVNSGQFPAYSNITCIGHSLGAHLCGFIAKNLPSPLGRISGLDPAGPGFMFASSEERLDKSDALFVDVIHTSIKFPKALGLAKPIGHVDFYPNDGGTQPGCLFVDPVCSHKRAIIFYTKSIYKECFSAYKKCYFLDMLYLVKYCRSGFFTGKFTTMGFGADNFDEEGSFYVETLEKKPYCVEDDQKTQKERKKT